MGNIVQRNKQFATLKTRLNDPKMLAQLANALPKSIPPKRLMRIVFTACQRNHKLMDCTQESMLASVFRAAELGLVPDGRQGALVPFNNNKKNCVEAQFMPMYQGLIDLVCNTQTVSGVKSVLVHENDDFTYREGLDPVLDHTPTIKGEPGEIIGVYAVAIMREGDNIGHFMPVWEVERYRNMSRAKNSNFWKDHWGAMAKKTAIRQLIKMLPVSSERIMQANDMEEAFERGENMIEADAIELIEVADEGGQESGSDDPLNKMTQEQTGATATPPRNHEVRRRTREFEGGLKTAGIADTQIAEIEGLQAELGEYATPLTNEFFAKNIPIAPDHVGDLTLLRAPEGLALIEQLQADLKRITPQQDGGNQQQAQEENPGEQQAETGQANQTASQQTMPIDPCPFEVGEIVKTGMDAEVEVIGTTYDDVRQGWNITVRFEGGETQNYPAERLHQVT